MLWKTGWPETGVALVPELSKISRSVLIITGTEDVAVPAANSLMLVQNIPDAWLVQIRDVGHGLMYQYPDEFSRIISTFMKTTN